MKSSLSRKSGFTLIEMIGVIAVIAILAAFITPKVFKTIEDTKITRFAGEVPSYSTAVTSWYKDIGSLQSLHADGTLDPTENAFQTSLITNGGTTPTTGRWTNWDGPYIDSVSNIFVGSALSLQTQPGTAGTAAPAATNSTAFDLDDDNANDMDSKQVVAIKLTGISDSEFAKVDGILDKGLTAANNATSGRVKYDATGDIVYIYLASL